MPQTRPHYPQGNSLAREYLGMKRSAPQRLVDRQGPRRELIRRPILFSHRALDRTEYREGSSQFFRILRIPRIINKISPVGHSSRIYGESQGSGISCHDLILRDIMPPSGSSPCDSHHIDLGTIGRDIDKSHEKAGILGSPHKFNLTRRRKNCLKEQSLLR